MTTTQDKSTTTQPSDDRQTPGTGQCGATTELTDEQLSRVSGGAVRRVRGGDDDLEDLEVER